MLDHTKAFLAAADKPNLLKLAAYADLLADALKLLLNQAFVFTNEDDPNVVAS